MNGDWNSYTHPNIQGAEYLTPRGSQRKDSGSVVTPKKSNNDL